MHIVQLKSGIINQLQPARGDGSSWCLRARTPRPLPQPRRPCRIRRIPLPRSPEHELVEPLLPGGVVHLAVRPDGVGGLPLVEVAQLLRTVASAWARSSRVGYSAWSGTRPTDPVGRPPPPCAPHVRKRIIPAKPLRLPPPTRRKPPPFIRVTCHRRPRIPALFLPDLTFCQPSGMPSNPCNISTSPCLPLRIAKLPQAPCSCIAYTFAPRV